MMMMTHNVVSIINVITPWSTQCFLMRNMKTSACLKHQSLDTDNYINHPVTRRHSLHHSARLLRPRQMSNNNPRLANLFVNLISPNPSDGQKTAASRWKSASTWRKRTLWWKKMLGEEFIFLCLIHFYTFIRINTVDWTRDITLKCHLFF